MRNKSEKELERDRKADEMCTALVPLNPGLSKAELKLRLANLRERHISVREVAEQNTKIAAWMAAGALALFGYRAGEAAGKKSSK